MQLWLLAAVCSFALISRAGAQAVPAPVSTEVGTAAGPQVALVVESDLAGASGRLRAELARQSGAKIADLREVIDNRGVQATSLAFLAISRGAHDTVSVAYWDSTGRVDALSAAASESAAFEVVAVALGSALLHRNLPRLSQDEAAGLGCAYCDFRNLATDLRSHAWSLVPVRRRTFPITLEDF